MMLKLGFMAFAGLTGLYCLTMVALTIRTKRQIKQMNDERSLMGWGLFHDRHKDKLEN